MARRKQKFGKWHLLLALLFIPISVYVGTRSAGEAVVHHVDQKAVQQAQKDKSRDVAETSPVPLEMVEQARLAEAKASNFSKVQKLIQEGVIQRINEKQRLLYVNDPVWEVSNAERKEYTIRVVAEYFDWIHGTHSRKIDVRSFRSGRRLASIGMGEVD